MDEREKCLSFILFYPTPYMINPQLIRYEKQARLYPFGLRIKLCVRRRFQRFRHIFDIINNNK